MAPAGAQRAVVCFGEVLLRLSPSGGGSLRDAARLDLHVGGAEANVAVALANLGIETRMVSALPDDDLGRNAIKALRREGVDCSGIAIGTGRMGVYFLTSATGTASGKVLYDRMGTAFAACAEPDSTLLDGARHLHLSGISLAVSAGAARATHGFASAAKQRGMTVSFDGNFRPSLWARTDRDPRAEVAELVAMADLFFGNHKDISLLLGRDFSGDGGQRRREAALAALEAFPNLSAIASTARHVERDGSHRIIARVDSADASAESAELVLTGIVDRIGTGDAFSAGVLAAWLGAPPDMTRMVESGMALSALKHFMPGDFCRANRDELAAAMAGGGDVAR
ncbi:sugar kinase [Novosphingopyxis baekryungensis]|uniref:sugar kinase n=1 Tax=Novosphingopyxis baekryungensis TaxID=279369 RepID=UPI0003B64FFB|nr:sugar kinase [Novosphingopyxis baekryungensis]